MKTFMCKLFLSRKAFAVPMFAAPMFALPIFALPIFALPMFALPMFALPMIALPMIAEAQVQPGSPSLAQLEFSLADATIAGTHCSRQEALLEQSGENEFAAYLPNVNASLGRSVGNLGARATCQLFIPIQVPNGVRITKVRLYSGIKVSKSQNSSAAATFLAYLGTAAGVEPQTLNFPKGTSHYGKRQDWHPKFPVPEKSGAECFGDAGSYTENLRFVSALSVQRANVNEITSAAISRGGAIYFVFDTEACID